MNRKILLFTIEIAVMILCLYFFFTPLILGASNGHFLEDGVVIGRTLLLIFMLANILKLSRLFLLDRGLKDK